MSQEVYTVEQAAERLKLHPKTILRAIREERLRATRVGKSYRILRGDLEGFGGLTPAARSAVGARATAIVDIPDVGAELAERLMSYLPATLNARAPGGPPAGADVIYDPDGRTVKVVIQAAPADAGHLLTLIHLFLER